MITRVQLFQLNEGLMQHLQKHGSKYLGAGALGAAGMAAHALSGESGEEVKGHAEDIKSAHEDLQRNTAAAQKVMKSEDIKPAQKTKTLQAIDQNIAKAREEKAAAMKKFASHPAVKRAGMGALGAGALGAAALAKRSKEKKQ